MYNRPDPAATEQIIEKSIEFIESENVNQSSNNMYQTTNSSFDSQQHTNSNHNTINPRIRHSPYDRSSTDFYTNLINHRINSLLEYQQYSLFNHQETSSSSSLSSSSSSNSKKLIVQDHKTRLSSNLATFVSESQVNNNKNAPFQQVNYSLVWSNVNYKVNENEFCLNLKKPFNWFRQKEKLILNNVSGCLKTGELVALLGPSGVGKSSLLEILAGRRVKGTSGKIDIDLEQLNWFEKGINRSVLENQEDNLNKIAFIPQQDYHFDWLTVYETLIYASKIKNCKIAKKLIYRQMKMKANLELYLKQQCKQNTKLGHHRSKEQFDNHIIMNQVNQQLNSTIRNEQEYHEAIVINILKDLSLIGCMHTIVRNCSGGQKRRLSIGLELLNQPRLILIDEPTTGLDFSSALKCIQTLRSLTMMNKPPGIIASIHQPSSLVLSQFHRVYALGKSTQGGLCIYDGQVDNLVNYFSSFEVNCPLYFNPADFCIQIANSDFGQQLIVKLADHQAKLHETRLNEMTGTNHGFQVHLNNQFNSKLNDPMYYRSNSINENTFTLSSSYQVSHLKINVKHLMKRLSMQTHPTGTHIKLLLQRSWKCTIREPTLTYLRLFQFLFTAFLIANLHNYKVGEMDGCFNDLTLNSTSKLDKASLIANGEDYVQQLAKIKDNSILLFFSLMFWVMSSIIPTLLTFPNEMIVFIKERSNGWYSCFSYYMAKMLCDLPFVIVCPFLFCIVFYPLTGQIMLWWRFLLFYFISLLLCLIAQSLGFIVGSIFIKDKFSAIFIGSVQSFPVFMAGGYLIRESVMNWLVKPLWHLSYIRYSFSAIIISIYGFGRCSDKQVDSNKSTLHTVLSNFSRTDKTLLSQVRSIVNEEDFNCLYDSYYTESGYHLDNYFRNCNLTLANLFSRTMNQNTVDLSRQLEQETKLYDNSFVLSYYEVTNDLFEWNILCLIATLILLRLINYAIILHNVKKHSKY